MGVTVRALTCAYLELKEAEHAGGLIGEEAMIKLHSYLGRFCAKYGDREAASLKPSDLTTFILGHASWIADATRENAARAVLGLLRWAEDDDRIVKNPIRKFKPCWNPLQPRGAMLSSEYHAIMRAAKTRGRRSSRIAFRAALYFLWKTGARTCEAKELRWADVDLEAGLIRMKGKTTRRTGRLRQIALNRALVMLFKWMFRERQPAPTDHVFLNGRGRKWERWTFARMFRVIADAAGVRKEVTAYRLRHLYCVDCLEAGLGERQIADSLGHSTTRLVGYYGADVRKNVGYLRDTQEKLHQFRKGRKQ